MSNSADAPAPLVVRNSGRWLGNDGSWSTFYVNSGTPPQYFHVLPSFMGQTLYMPISDDCARLNVTDCGTSRGVEIFSSRPSLGFQTNASSTWSLVGIYGLDIGSNFGLVGNTLYGYDRAGISLSSGGKDNVTLDRQVVSAFATPNQWMGQLGLSPFVISFNETETPQSLLQRLKDDGLIPSLSFGYQAGAAHRFTKVPGSLVLGGYDQTRRSNNSIMIPSPTDLSVGLQSITIDRHNDTVTVLNTAILAVIDTAVPELWLPPNVCDQIASALNLTFHEESDRYALTAVAHSALQALNPIFSFRIGTDVHNSPAITIEIPYAAFDLEASYPLYASPTKYFPLRRADNNTQYALGRAFLQEVYMVVDWEREVFNLSQAVFSAPMPEPSIIAIEPKLSETKSHDLRSAGKLSAGAIAGIVIGIVLLFVGILAGLWFWRRRQKRGEAARYPGVLQAMQEAEGGDKKLPSELGLGNRREADVELEGDQHHAVEMHAPFKTHELAHGNGDHVPVEVDSPNILYEMPDTSRNRR